MSDSLELIDLGDDEIIQIFSLLSFTDLLAMRSTCQRFLHLALYTFSVYPKRVELKLLKSTECDPFERLQTFFDTFGPHIKELTFNGMNDTDGSYHFFDLLRTNFYPSKLKLLKLVKTTLTFKHSALCSRILENLETIELIECTAVDPEAIDFTVTACRQLKGLSLIDLVGLNGQYLLPLSNQLESINLQNLRTWENANQRIILNVGSNTKRLILRHIFAVIVCESKDLSNLETLKLDLLSGMTSPFAIEVEYRVHRTSLELLPYIGNKLKHLHLASVASDGTEISKIGNRLESFSLDNSRSVRSEYIYTLLTNNQNLRSVKLCHMGDASLYQEVPQRVPNVEQLCIWPAQRARCSTIGDIIIEGILTLSKLKSFTFFSSPSQTCDLIGQLAQMDSLETLGCSVEADDFNTNFDEKLRDNFYKLKKLKCLKLALNGRLNTNAFEKIATHLVDLEELKLVHGDVVTQVQTHYTESSPTSDCNQLTNCGYCCDAGIDELEFSQFVKSHLPVILWAKLKMPMKIYQTQRDHNQSIFERIISAKLLQDSYKDVVQLHPLSNDGFFEFYTKNCVR